MGKNIHIRKTIDSHGREMVALYVDDKFIKWLPRPDDHRCIQCGRTVKKNVRGRIDRLCKGCLRWKRGRGTT